MKWQPVSGTTEQKVPFEVMCLAEVVLSGEYPLAYLGLGGAGWTLRDHYTRGGLKAHLGHADLARIVSLERFIALADRGRL